MTSRTRRICRVSSSVGIVVTAGVYAFLFGSPGRMTRIVYPEFGDGIERFVANDQQGDGVGLNPSQVIYLVQESDPKKQFADPELDRLANLYRESDRLIKLIILADYVKVVPWEYRSTDGASRWLTWYLFTTSIPGCTRSYAICIVAVAFLGCVSSLGESFRPPHPNLGDWDDHPVRSSLVWLWWMPVMLTALLLLALLLAYLGHEFPTTWVGAFLALTPLWPVLDHLTRIILGLNPIPLIGLAVSLAHYCVAAIL